MKLVAIWQPSADKDLEAALDYIGRSYQNRFWQVLGETVERIQDHPEIYPVVYPEKQIRRVLLRPFQLFLFYKVEPERIRILAL